MRVRARAGERAHQVRARVAIAVRTLPHPRFPCGQERGGGGQEAMKAGGWAARRGEFGDGPG